MATYLNKTVLMQAGMGLLLSVCASAVSASAGKVIYGFGEYYAQDRDGNRRDLKRGAPVEAGDTLVTGRGRIHVRFSDGGLVSIYPDSKYRIDQFRFQAPAEAAPDKGEAETVQAQAADRPDTADKPKARVRKEEDRGFFSLLKGAVRQVTGLLGRKNPDSFRVKTAVATIGIRGTGFFAQLCQADCVDADGKPKPDGLYVKNNTGVITVSSGGGSVSLAQGQSAFAADSGDSPRQTIQPPVAYDQVNPDLELYDFDQNVSMVARQEAIDEAGNGDPQPPDPTPVLNLTRAEYMATTDLFAPALTASLDTANTDNSMTVVGDAIEAFQTVQNTDGGPVTVNFDKGAATLVEKGYDASLGVLWNRWQGAFTYTSGGTAITTQDDNMHLIASENITPTLPGAARGGVTYTLAGGTSPTMVGPAGQFSGTQTVNMDIDYSTAEVENLQLDLAFSDGTTINATLKTITILTATSGNEARIGGSCSGGNCGANGGLYDGNFSINLVGPNAEGIYGSYNMVSGGSGESAVSGGSGESAVSGAYFATENGGANVN